MSLVIATTEDAPFDGVLWTAYRSAGGPAPDAIFFLPSRSFRARWQAAVESFLLFGPHSLFRLVSSHVFNTPATEEDREAGLHRCLQDLFPAAEYREVESLNTSPGLDILAQLEPKILVSVGSPEIFTPSVLKIPTYTALNLHNGKLPAYRGVFGTFWELYQNEETGGVSLHRMQPKVDAGEVVSAEEIDLTKGLFEILLRKKEVGGRLLAEYLSQADDESGEARPARAYGQEMGYYGWPTLSEVIRMRWRQS